jgi:hypothetical protein
MLSILRVSSALLLIALGVAPAFARCSFGSQSLPGNIPPGVEDYRSFTVQGGALLTVAGATDRWGNPVSLLVSFPGHCLERSAPTVSCTVHAFGQVEAIIYNPSGAYVQYTWVCTSLR